MRINSRSGLSRAAFVLSVALSFLAVSRVFAQAPAAAASPAAAGGTAEAERVIVTGSNIPTAEEVGPNPVYNLNRDLINKSGAGTTTEQLLQRQPMFSGGNIPVNNNGTGQSGPTGTAGLGLRGLDAGATLVLVDGRRVAPFPGSALSGYGFVDLTTIPITAVQSIEILKDGASTTYGSDAVAGVVNFKLFKDYRGVQVTEQYGNTLDKDAAEYRGDVLFGVGDDKTSITGDMFYYKHHDMFNHDRGNSLVPPFYSSNAVPWNFQVSRLAAANPFDTSGAPQPAPVLPPGTQPNIFTTPPDAATGLTPAADFVFNFAHPTTRVRGTPTNPNAVLPGFNFNSLSSSFPEQERWGGYTAFSHKVCDDQFQVYGDFYYVDAKTHDELAPTATNNFQQSGRAAIFIPPNHPFTAAEDITPPFGGPTPAEVGQTPGSFNPFNPFEQIISGGTRARVFEFGNRLIDNENIAERFTAGFKGDKLFDGTWGYDGGFMYSQIQQQSKFRGINISRFEQIMNANDPIFNPASSSFVGQTVPYNPFVDFRSVTFPTNPALVDYARLNTKDIFTSKLATLDLNIYTTSLFKLPAGGVGFAFGGAFNRESYTVDPDDQNRLGVNADIANFPFVKAGRKSWSIYAEALIPVFSPEMNVPGFHALEFSAGVRYGEWLNNDTNAAVPKFGMRWQPFDDSLTIRSTWGEGFLEPSMVQLYGPQRFGLAPVGGFTRAPATTATGSPISVPLTGPGGVPCTEDDPTCQLITNPEETVQQPPNPKLAPEHDRTWTAGIVYTPKWIPSKYGTFTLSIDLWDIERTGIAMYLSPNTIITNYNAGSFGAITLPNQPTASSPPQVIFDQAGNFAGVTSPYINGGRSRTNGFDLGLQYQIETGFGTFSMLSRWSYLNEFVSNFPGEKPRQAAGSSSSEWFLGSYWGDVTNPQAWLKWRGDTQFDWTWNNWDLNATVHYLGGYWEEILATKFDGVYKRHWVDNTFFTDAQLSYSLIFTTPVETQPVAGYSKDHKEVVRGKDGKAVETPEAVSLPCWKNLLNNSTFTVGVNNIFGSDPPAAFGFEHGNSVGYPGGLYDNLGRFVYWRLIKKF